nr:hypothetical protein [Legionella jordanis]
MAASLTDEEIMAKQICYHVFMGDSLSDPGFMDHRKLAGIIPMDGLSGLKGKSPQGSFTNGYVWDKDFGITEAEECIIKQLEYKGQRPTDIADGIIDHEERIERPFTDDFQLDVYRQINFKHQDFVRYYAEGGLTSYNYSGRITADFKLLATEKILSTLEGKRQLLLEDDKARGITQDHRDETLITEWSGANDLITVNNRPSKEEAERAVKARLDNVEQLIKVGYCHFVLFDLPDLSLTPRFQKMEQSEQNNAHVVCLYFNELLNQGVARLRKAYSYCDIDVFNASGIFKDAYEHPERYALDVNKLHTPYITSPDFKIKPNHTSPAPGYMFWDDVHPSAHVQDILAEKYAEKYSLNYSFSTPHESLITQFKETYGQCFEDDLRGWFSFFRTSHISYNNPMLKLECILDHALNQGGQRSRKVIQQLGWINGQGQLLSKNPELVKAMEHLRQPKSTVDVEQESGALSLFD